MNINYNFYHWGPFLYKTKILDEEVKKILSFCKKKKSLDSRRLLAGHIKEEYKLNSKEIFPVLTPYLSSYVQALYEQRRIIIKKNIEMRDVWVNYMKQGEFNPPHMHEGNLSCVLYLQIPRDMNKNKKNHIANSAAPGSIAFQYGENLKNNFVIQNFFPEVGDFFIFPAWLNHYVYPFKSNEERISLSANFYEI
jgi:uncharacterized protein (TIGR02466 family)